MGCVERAGGGCPGAGLGENACRGGWGWVCVVVKGLSGAMLRFLVLNPELLAGVNAGPMVMERAYLIGPEQVPTAGELTLEGSVISCRRSTSDAAALAVSVRLDGERLRGCGLEGLSLGEGGGLSALGELTLRTCLLPDRERPYLLMIELARHQLMLFVNKLEDWQLTDLPAEGVVMRLYQLSKEAFTRALVSGLGDGGVEAEGAATRALWLAIEAGERLSLLSAARDFQPRVSGEVYESVSRLLKREPPVEGKPAPSLTWDERPGVIVPGRPAVGCGVSPGQFGESACRAVAGVADFITVPMRWMDIEPREGEYSFAGTDRWIEWAVRTAKLPVVAGPLIDFRPGVAPEWLYIWENDYETLRELAYEHVKSLVTRYRRTVKRWLVVSGLHQTTHFRLNFDQVMDLTRIAVLTVKKLHPQASIQVELTHPWGEYFAGKRRGLAPTMYAEMVNQTGMPIDGFSLRMYMGEGAGGHRTRDLLEFASMLDRYAVLDRPLSISAIGVPSRPAGPEGAGGRGGGRGPGAAGFGSWRGAWSEAIQADWLTSALGIALSRSYVESVCWHDLSDGPGQHEIESGGLVTASGEGRAALGRLGELRRACRDRVAPGRLAALLRPGGVDERSAAK